MIKTLRITTFIAAFLAVGFFAFPVVFGYRGDEQVEKFLKLPGAIEKFNKAKGAKPLKEGDQVSPLVKEAVAFALYLNPPPKAAPKPTKIPPVRKPTTTANIPAPTRSSAKFTLIGTSFFPSRPEMSLAYIDEPGKGLYWVRQGSQVGHLLIEQVQDGSVIVKDSEKSVTLVAARTPRKSLIKGETTSEATPSLPSSSTSITSGPDVQVSVEKSVSPASGNKRSASAARSRGPEASAEEAAMMEKLMLELSAMEADAKAGKTDSRRNAERSEALLDKYISDLEAMRVTTEEAKRLDRLGEELKREQRDPNLAGDSKVQSSGKPPISRPPRRPTSRRQPPRPPR
jgi:hypothetical protein